MKLATFQTSKGASYGVVIRPDGLTLDEEATRALRGETTLSPTVPTPP